MKNIAGAPVDDATRAAVAELGDAEIPCVPVDPGHAEVQSFVGGKLGPYTLTRAWRYWIIKGLIPLSLARELYADPVGQRDVRVTGHCGCPAPEGFYITWFIAGPDGANVRVLDRKNEAEAKKYADMGDGQTTMARIGREILASNVFADDPSTVPGVKGYVDGYHIDTPAGLKLFADGVRRHGLHNLPAVRVHAGSPQV